MKLLKVNVQYREVEVCHMLSRFRRTVNNFRRFVKLENTFVTLVGGS